MKHETHLFHHSYIEAEREKERRAAWRRVAFGAAVIGAALVGFFIGRL